MHVGLRHLAPAVLLAVLGSLTTAACSQTASRDRDGGTDTPDAATPPPDAACEPVACGPIPDGCRAGPPATPCGCPTVICDPDPGCENFCPPPPPGCWYDPAFPTAAPCGVALACEEHLICEPGCAIECAAPPPGCHYEGGVFDGPCDLLTCGTLVCTDPPPSGTCPSGAGPCCARATTFDPSRIPMRVVGIELAQPLALANATIIGIMQGAMDGDRLNWLVTLDSTGFAGPAILSSPGVPAPGSTGFFEVLMPVVTLPAVDSGGSWSGGPADGVLELPIPNDDGSLLVTLPLDDLVFDELPLSDDRTCVGARTGRRWDTPGAFHAIIRVEDARRAFIEALGMDLCALLAGTSCAMPMSTWRIPPDVVCADGTPCGWRTSGNVALALTPTGL